MNKIGIYVHIPFCATKCPYCDFYSISYNKQTAAAYTAAVIRNMRSFSGRYSADTLFFGGGTPTLLGEGLSEITKTAKDVFGLENAEITIQANPKTVNESLLKAWYNAGINRISFGVQSLCDDELKMLGRRHTASDALKSIFLAKECGFTNISADLMLGIPNQTVKSVKESINGLASAGVKHISAYMLQIEEGTPFFENNIEKICPSENDTVNIYLSAIDELENLGLYQYEISNFAVSGYESQHNLKYWNCKEYLGFGASAHSFINNTRFAVENNADKFISSPLQETYITDDNAGTAEEYEMLALRLKKGISKELITSLFGEDEFLRIKKNAEKIDVSYININDDSISFTRKGFLVSNDLISRLIW